ncbi:MAG: hypothetical protein CMM62_06140 [Rhodospirillaceae bacterium]|nr:hypothetical protein [Rhodospirillaceae bacterium]
MSKLLFLLLLIPTTALSQSFIKLKELDAKKSKGITIVEFWAPFNQSNEVAFIKELDDCRPYRLCIATNPEASSQYSIVSVPTVVVFDNGVEVLRYTPNILMQLVATQREVQSDIDEIILKKFQ